MGIPTEGGVLTWDETVAVRELYKYYALSQLVRIFEKSKDRQGDPFMWGDELEFCLVRFDHAKKCVQLLLKANQLLPRLIKMNEAIQNGNCRVEWHPEAANYMVEGVPSKPYGYMSFYLSAVEANMAFRRKQAQKMLSEESDCEYILNISCFPQFGQHRFAYPTPENQDCQCSTQPACYSYAITSTYDPRFKLLGVNKTKRTKTVPLIHIPIFQDSATPSPFRDYLFEDTTKIQDNHIYLAGDLSGWGCCCLQVTFQAQSLTECLHLYDQLLPLTPIMLALSGACPVWRGYLTDIDCRYNVLSLAAEDRTPEERQRPNLTPRCSPVPLYLSDEHNHLNDLKLDLNENVVSTLIHHGMSPALARHFGYLFIRDPLVLAKEPFYSTDDSSAYHFENLNATVWYCLRLKPPPLNNDEMGWRIEFRPMDIQITDFENAALAVFMALLTRVILTYGLELTIPITQVNENMDRAHHRDSVRQEKFYFRVGHETSMMSIDEIMNGFTGFPGFPGLVPLVEQYLDEHEHIDSDTRRTIDQYLSLISKRAAGILLTDASWIREFVTSHVDYKHDSVVSDEIQYDLLWKMGQIANGHESCPLLLESHVPRNTDIYQ